MDEQTMQLFEEISKVKLGNKRSFAVAHGTRNANRKKNFIKKLDLIGSQIVKSQIKLMQGYGQLSLRQTLLRPMKSTELHSSSWIQIPSCLTNHFKITCINVCMIEKVPFFNQLGLKLTHIDQTRQNYIKILFGLILSLSGLFFTIALETTNFDSKIFFAEEKLLGFSNQDV